MVFPMLDAALFLLQFIGILQVREDFGSPAVSPMTQVILTQYGHVQMIRFRHRVAYYRSTSRGPQKDQDEENASQLHGFLIICNTTNQIAQSACGYCDER